MGEKKISFALSLSLSLPGDDWFGGVPHACAWRGGWGVCVCHTTTSTPTTFGCWSPPLFLPPSISGVVSSSVVVVARLSLSLPDMDVAMMVLVAPLSLSLPDLWCWWWWSPYLSFALCLSLSLPGDDCFGGVPRARGGVGGCVCVCVCVSHHLRVMVASSLSLSTIVRLLRVVVASFLLYSDLHSSRL